MARRGKMETKENCVDEGEEDEICFGEVNEIQKDIVLFCFGLAAGSRVRSEARVPIT